MQEPPMAAFCYHNPKSITNTGLMDKSYYHALSRLSLKTEGQANVDYPCMKRFWQTQLI